MRPLILVTAVSRWQSQPYRQRRRKREQRCSWQNATMLSGLAKLTPNRTPSLGSRGQRIEEWLELARLISNSKQLQESQIETSKEIGNQLYHLNCKELHGRTRKVNSNQIIILGITGRRKRAMISTTFIHRKLSYFFTCNELIDLEVGAGLNLSMASCIDALEQAPSSGSQQKYKARVLEASLSLLTHLLKARPSPETFLDVKLDTEKFRQAYQSDGLRCCIFALRNFIDCLAASPGKVTIMDEMIVKTLINLLYTLVFGCKYVFDVPEASASLKTLLEDLDLDGLLIRMVSITLEAYYLPIKKLVMLYTRVLAILFAHPPTPSLCGEKHQEDLYHDSEMLWLSSNNLLTEDYLQTFKEKSKPEEIKSKHKDSPIEAFYARHNVGDCPLAQSIVVGLLRSLLTICNSQTHKKFQVSLAKGSGADSYREWQISYQFVHQMSSSKEKEAKDYRQYLSSESAKMLKDYLQYNEASSQGSSEKLAGLGVATLPTHSQFYKHKIYTTLAISTFFSFLLVSFRKNATIQFTYLYQLISDANGVLVFLKFLTDKFQSLEPAKENGTVTDFRSEQNSKMDEGLIECSSLPHELLFKDEVMLTVYSVLLMLYGACNNYTEKTRSYLFEYNSYLIIKKIPHIFMKVHKNDDQLPSEEEIEAEFGAKGDTKGNEYEGAIRGKVKELTELCYSLLKIQIPFFSKKMKENTNNMKMIVEIYCQMPKKMEPIQRTELDKLLLKNQMRKIQHEKYILSVEELKAIHNEYNNLYYWSNEEAKLAESKDKPKEDQAPLHLTPEAMEKWLQENVWQFYD